MHITQRINRHAALGFVGGSLILVAAACGSSKAASPATAAATPTSASSAGSVPTGGGFDNTAIQTALDTFTACLRTNGLTSVADVDASTLGGPGRGGRGGASGGADGGEGGFQPPTSDFTGEVPTGSFPTGADATPPGGGRGPGGGMANRVIASLGLDSTDATVTSALAACQPALETAMQSARGGFGGRKPGAASSTSSTDPATSTTTTT